MTCGVIFRMQVKTILGHYLPAIKGEFLREELFSRPE